MSPTDPTPGRKRRSRRGLPRLFAAAAVAIFTVTTWAVASYVHALTAPGNATWAEATISWIRDRGGSPVVDAIENWYYTRHGAPTTPAGFPSHAVPLPVQNPTLALPVLPNLSKLPGEAAWMPGRRAPNGQPTSYTSYFQPDPAHAGVIVGVAILRSDLTSAHLVAGTREPGGTWPEAGMIPPTDVHNLVATFNSGYKFVDTVGGFYNDGRIGRTLVDGQASLVIDDRGRMVIGEWGHTVAMNPHVVAVRQNLALIVADNHPVAGLWANASHQWGAEGTQHQITWRSGLGLNKSGDVVYVAGDHLSLVGLADAMTQAGVMTGMELDIHSGMATYAMWAPTGTGVTPRHLLPSMKGDPRRYLASDRRDFIYVTRR